MENNCPNCKFRKTRFSDIGGVTDEMTRVGETFHVQCLAGNNKEIVEFYTKNKDVPSSEITDILSCFTKTKLTEKMDNLMELLDKALEK